MPKFLLTFTGPGDAYYEKAVEARNSDDAMRIGHSMNMRYKGYDNLWVSEYPYDSAGVFGFEVETEHIHFGKQRNYVFIKANNLGEATSYYNQNVRGKYFNHSKKIIPESEGWQKFGRIIRSYSAATDRFDFDATDNYVGGSTMPRKFTKYPSNYVKASYIEPTGKPTLSGVRACFYGVPKDQYNVINRDGTVVVITGRDMHRYWYAMEKLFDNYVVVHDNPLSDEYEIVSLK